MTAAVQQPGARCKTTPIVHETAGREPYALAVRSELDRYFVLLPDPNGGGSWQVRCGPGLPLEADSRHGWVFTLAIELQTQAMDAREYLLDVARKQRAGMASHDWSATALAISQPPKEMMEFTVRGKQPDGRPFESNNLRTFRQRRDGAALVMHVSVEKGTRESRERQLSAMRKPPSKTFAAVGDNLDATRMMFMPHLTMCLRCHPRASRRTGNGWHSSIASWPIGNRAYSIASGEN